MSDPPHFPLLRRVVFPVSLVETWLFPRMLLPLEKVEKEKSFNSEETLITSVLKATKATLILILFSSQTVSPVAGLS